MRRGLIGLIAGGLAVVAVAGLAGWLYERPTMIAIAVARDTDEHRLISAAAQLAGRQREKIRIRIVTVDHATASAAALDAGDVDFAVVRTDAALPKNGQTAVILYRSAALIVAPPGSDIKSASDLKGKRIGFLQPGSGAMASLALLERLLAYYGATADTTPRIQVAFEDLREAISQGRIDALVAVGPAGSGAVAEAIAEFAAASAGPPVFVPVNQSKALAQLSPALESRILPRGAFGGSPAYPPEDFETVTVTTRLLARSTARDSLVGDVTRFFFSERQAIAAISPFANRMEAPSTDKDAKLPAHAGAAAWLDGEQETFFEKYSDFIYIGAMLLSVFASAGAALLSRLDSARRVRSEELIESLLAHLAAARNARAIDDLDALEADADRILVNALQADKAKAFEAHRVTALGLALDQVRLAIRDRRATLAGAPLTEQKQSGD